MDDLPTLEELRKRMTSIPKKEDEIPKLRKIRTNTMHDAWGCYPVSHFLYRRELIFKDTKRQPVTRVEMAYDRVLSLHNMIDQIAKWNIKLSGEADALSALTYQRAVLTEALRIIYQEIQLERGYDFDKMQKEEKDRTVEDIAHKIKERK